MFLLNVLKTKPGRMVAAFLVQAALGRAWEKGKKFIAQKVKGNSENKALVPCPVKVRVNDGRGR